MTPLFPGGNCGQLRHNPRLNISFTELTIIFFLAD
jgi:hypothetical protein